MKLPCNGSRWIPQSRHHWQLCKTLQELVTYYGSCGSFKSQIPEHYMCCQCSWLLSRNDGETLLLMTSKTWVMEYQEVKLLLTWKLHPYWLARFHCAGRCCSCFQRNKRIKQCYQVSNLVIDLMPSLALISYCYTNILVYLSLPRVMFLCFI